MEMKSLVTSFEDSISEEVSGCVTELTEVGLDAIMEEGLLKDIPFVSTAISIYKIGKSLKERHYVTKLVAFLDEINKGSADEEKRKTYRLKCAANQEFRNKELEYVLVLIDRYISLDKPRMLGKLYLSYLDNVIDWEEFTMYAEVIDRLLLLDCRDLISSENRTTVLFYGAGSSVQRLVALGLMVEIKEKVDLSVTDDEGIPISDEMMRRIRFECRVFKKTLFGEKLANILR